MTIPAAPPAPPTPAHPAPAAPAPSMSAADEKTWSTFTHLGGLVVGVLAPPFGFLAPLVAYLVLKDRGPFVRAQTATALNFQLTLLIGYAVGGILTIVLVGFLVLAAVWVLSVVFSIVAAVRANRGEWYRYPVTIPFLS